MVSTKKPEIVVFAGPNGSGKSTFTEVLRPLMDYINADEIRKNLKCGELEAAQLAERQREERLAARRDFCFETVLSTPRNLRLLERAKQAGYFIRCYYVLTADPCINVYRVKARVASGGHDVPEEKIYTRFVRAMELVPAVVAVSDICQSMITRKRSRSASSRSERMHISTMCVMIGSEKILSFWSGLRIWSADR